MMARLSFSLVNLEVQIVRWNLGTMVLTTTLDEIGPFVDLGLLVYKLHGDHVFWSDIKLHTCD